MHALCSTLMSASKIECYHTISCSYLEYFPRFLKQFKLCCSHQDGRSNPYCLWRHLHLGTP